MATIKSYTDLEQSKKLAEILPLESADMFYNEEPEDESYPKDIVDTKYPMILREGDIRFLEEYGIPCWSLAALLGVLPNSENISTTLSKGGYKISTLEYTNSWFVDYEDETNSLNNCVTSADNPVDACVAMIEKLNELKML